MQSFPAWPERWVGVLAAIEIGILLFMGIIGNPHAGEPDWFAAFPSVAGHVLAATALPFWCALRFIDLLTGGPRRRLMARARASASGSPSGQPPEWRWTLHRGP